jgi:hypothetical protein
LLANAQGDSPQERRTGLLLRGHEQERLILHDDVLVLVSSSALIQPSIQIRDIGPAPVFVELRRLKLALSFSLPT